MGNCVSLLRRKQVKKQAPTSTQSPESKELQPPRGYGAGAYEQVGQLGSGKTGTMKLMKNKKTKELVAAKFVERVAGAGLSKNTEREIVNHRRLLHPNIIRFHEVYMTDDHLVIVMEYASGGTLEQRVQTGGPLPEAKCRNLFLQLASGLEYCHSRSIFHRDLRLQNLHLHGSHFEPQLKITGFGYSKSAVFDSQPKTNVGSPCYTPPELLMYTRNEGAVYDGGPNDVWSAGIILYYMLTGTMPFEDPATPGALNRKMMQKIVNVEYRFTPNVKLSPECKDFIGNIFVKDPKARLTTAEMRRHPWLAGTTLSGGKEVDESQQTELEIHDIVEKARRRRADKPSRALKKVSDSRASGPANSVNGSHLPSARSLEPKTPEMYELGIAEVQNGSSTLQSLRSRKMISA